jgi:hypothetical protein
MRSELRCYVCILASFLAEAERKAPETLRKGARNTIGLAIRLLLHFFCSSSAIPSEVSNQASGNRKPPGFMASHFLLLSSPHSVDHLSCRRKCRSSTSCHIAVQLSHRV